MKPEAIEPSTAPPLSVVSPGLGCQVCFQLHDPWSQSEVIIICENCKAEAHAVRRQHLARADRFLPASFCVVYHDFIVYFVYMEVFLLKNMAAARSLWLLVQLFCFEILLHSFAVVLAP